MTAGTAHPRRSSWHGDGTRSSSSAVPCSSSGCWTAPPRSRCTSALPHWSTTPSPSPKRARSLPPTPFVCTSMQEIRDRRSKIGAHAPLPPDPRSLIPGTARGRGGEAMAVKTFVETIRDTLAEEMARDERIIVLGEDVGVKGGVFKATDGLLSRFGEERVIDTPLAEDSIVGVAIGAALNGLLPVAEIQFADFIYPAMDQIISEAARLRYRTNGAFGCPLVIRAPYGGGVHGALYHSQSLEAFFLHVPGLKICAPSTPAETKGLLTAAIRDEDPVIFFEHKKLYRSIKADVPDGEYVLPIGKADLKRSGDDLSIITYGAMLHLALEAADQLAQQDGVSVEVLDLRSLLPLDREAIAATVHKTNRALILHEDTRTGGVGAEVAAFLAEELFDDLDAPIVRLTGPDVPAMGYNHRLEEAFLPQLDDLLAAVRRLAAY